MLEVLPVHDVFNNESPNFSLMTTVTLGDRILLFWTSIMIMAHYWCRVPIDLSVINSLSIATSIQWLCVWSNSAIVILSIVITETWTIFTINQCPQNYETMAYFPEYICMALIDLCKDHHINQQSSSLFHVSSNTVELAWRSGRVMDCHATARGSIPGGYRCIKRALRPSQGTGAVSKWPRCRWDIKHN